MSDYMPAIITVGVLVGMVILAVVITKVADSRKSQHSAAKLKKRANIEERVKKVAEDAREQGLLDEKHEDAQRLQATLKECRSLLRDGQRPLDKVERLTNQLEEQYKELVS